MMNRILGNRRLENETRQSSARPAGFITDSRDDKETCNCCKKNTVVIKTVEYAYNGNRVAKPTIEYIGGIREEDVIICDDCFSACTSDIERQALWIRGKINRLEEEISEIGTGKSENNEKIRLLCEANDKIDMKISEIRELQDVYRSELEIRISK